MKRFISVLLVIALLVPMLCVDVFAANKTVNNFAELKAAIADASVTEITLNGDLIADSTIEITRDIKISGGSIKSAMSGLTGADIKEGNLFYIKDGHTLTLENITLDGDNKCRLIRAQGAKLNLTNVTMKNGSTENLQRVDKNGKNDQNYSGGAILAEEASIVTIKGGSFENNNTGTQALDGSRAAEGGAIKLYQSELYINDETTTVKDTTKFTGNHLDDWQTAGGRQGGAIEATESKVEIYGTTFNIPGPFNTGGAIKFEDCGTETEKVKVINSSFTILGDKKPVGMAGGAITSEGSHLFIDNSDFNTGKGSYVQESGGLIQVVGTGTFDLKNSELNGSGVGWNATGANKTAKYGGAIVFYDNSTVTATIENPTIQNFTAEISGGAITVGTQLNSQLEDKDKKGKVNLTIKDTKILNNLAYAWNMTTYGGGIFIGKGLEGENTGNTVEIQGGQISSEQYSSVAGAIYNEGNLTLTKSDKGNAQIINNKAYHMAGGILNDGYLKVDYAKFEGNKKGDWSTGEGHVFDNNPDKDKKELPGVNIYAVKDVIITPNAIFDGKDVRILDGQSKIILTGELKKQINVSISENPKQQGNDTLNNPAYPIHPKFNETQKRKVGYLVAVGDGTYQATAEDAQKIHYVSKDTDPAQPRADFADHTSPGKWDYVLNPENNTIVLGQRVKLVYHGNTGKIGTEVKKEKTVDVYKAGNFWEKQLDKYKVADPEKAKNEFMGWYFWKFGEDAGETNNDSTIQALKKPEEVKANLFDFSKFDFSNKNETETTNIITPNVINTYAGWSENIDLEVEKKWLKSDGKDLDDNDKVEVKINLKGGEEDKTLTLNSANEFKGKFENLPVFTKSYDPAEKEINMNLKFTPKEYKVKEEKLEGFTTSYEPETITANSDDAKKITITNKKEEPKNYKVNYEFISRTPNKALPTTGTIVELLPKDDTNHATGEKITAGALAANEKYDSVKKTVDVEDGTWTFKGWVKEKNSTVDPVESLEQTIIDQNLNFVGVWTFEAKTYNVTYAFKPEDSSKTLPEAVTKLKPADQTGVANGTKITPATFNSVTDGEDTWTFTGWDKSSQTINGKDIHFVGTWALAVKPEQKTGSVYVKYVDEEGKEIADKTELKKDAPVGEDYTATPKTIEGYETGVWQEGSAPEKGKVEEGEKTVVYVYKKTEPTPEPKSDFKITKTVDKKTYKKAGEVLTYTITVTNIGEAELKGLKLSDSLVKDEELKKLGLETTFNLKVKESKEFKYTYTITDADVRAQSVTNTATVTHGKDSKEAKATSILKEKEKRGDVYVRYETEDGKILDEFAVLIDAPVGTYYYTEEKAFPRYRFVGLAPYSDPAEGYVVEGTQYVVYLYRRDRGGRTPDRRDRYEREEKEVEEPVVEAKRKPELNKKDHKQYMYGYPDWTFVPAANITRGEAAAMFARLFKEYPGLDYNYKKYYTDVDESYWGFKEVAYLSEFGILSGYSDGTFRPNNKITRAEFVKIAESFEALIWGLSPYNDVDGGHWAFRYIVSSAAKGWISGYPDGSFRPNSFISRAEAVTIVNRLLERRPDKDYIDTHKPELKPFTDLKPSYWAYYEIYEAVDGHDYNRSFTDIEEHWYRLNNERFVFSQPRYYR